MSTEYDRPEHSFKSDGGPEFRSAEPAHVAALVPDAIVDVNSVSAVTEPRLTVVIPTRNERHNIASLLARLGPAVAPLNAELIIVDDSDDDTPCVVVEQA